MKQELEESLAKEFPRVIGGYRDMACGDGWYGLLRDLCAGIDKVLSPADKFVVEQIKEKFAGLRFYWTCQGLTEEVHGKIWGLVGVAEEASYKTCEVCGEPGVARSASWLRTLCEKHAEGKPPARGFGWHE